jgi:chemotaxis protein methyltransferase CheR
MRPEDVALIADLLKKRSGMALAQDKEYLIESRLLPVARHYGLADIETLCDRLRSGADEALLYAAVEAMTINESSFFRDIEPFELLRQQLLPMLMEKQSVRGKLRVWSAASATGQEPYSIAICIKEEMRMAGWEVELIATDLARKVLDKAKRGIYSQFEVQRGMPIQLLVKYFTQLTGGNWQVKDSLRSMVDFCPQNLLESYDSLGQFDLIFCRNVFIYFDETARIQVVRRLAQSLHPHGALIIGATESLADPDGRFIPVDNFRGAYRLK